MEGGEREGSKRGKKKNVGRVHCEGCIGYTCPLLAFSTLIFKILKIIIKMYLPCLCIQYLYVSFIVAN